MSKGAGNKYLRENAVDQAMARAPQDLQQRLAAKPRTLREELESEFGEPLQPKGDLKNWFAWLGFEELREI